MRCHSRIVGHLCALGVFATLAACGTSSASGPDAPASGVQGVAMVDAGCPMARHATPCPDHPLRAHVTITKTGSEKTVASADTDAQGRFQITLTPGLYTLHATNMTGAPVPYAPPYPVTVDANKFTVIQIQFDSGIR